MGFTLENISHYFPHRSGQIHALNNLSFDISRGTFVAVVGPSGCGKSTLLKIIAGIIKPSTGNVTFMQEARANQLQTALVFQDYGIFPWLNVLNNVAYGLESMGVGRRARNEAARQMIQQVGLAGFEKAYPHELSGGMQQRVGIARAWITQPNVLMMDEPFASLDAQTKIIHQEMLLALWNARKTTILYVTHDIDEAILMADRVLVMSGRPGTIVAEYPVTMPRPRDLIRRQHKDFDDLRWKIWKHLEEQVRAESKPGSESNMLSP